MSLLPERLEHLATLGLDATRTPKSIVGSYYSGDGLGRNITLVLQQDGQFWAIWRGCLGKYGEASGNWRVEESRIHFEPSVAEGLLGGYLIPMEVVRSGKEWAFVRRQSIRGFGGEDVMLEDSFRKFTPPPPLPPKTLCSVPGCGRLLLMKGFCVAHQPRR